MLHKAFPFSQLFSLILILQYIAVLLKLVVQESMKNKDAKMLQGLRTFPTIMNTWLNSVL